MSLPGVYVSDPNESPKTRENDESPQSPFAEMSDDALATVLASNIQNDPNSGCELLRVFRKSRKYLDDNDTFWMNVAANLGVAGVPLMKGWNWSIAIG